MKIGIYNIAKNEKDNVHPYLANVVDADWITFCDTGSTDGTVEEVIRAAAELGIAHKVSLHQVSVSPWRFDFARNVSLGLVPADIDICIPMDLDDRMHPGWRDQLESSWVIGETSAAAFKYIFARHPDGREWVSYMHNRIHQRYGFYWKYPCHEGLYGYAGTRGHTVNLPNLVMEGFQDRTKDRSQYFELLKMGVQEYPNDARMTHYFGRELCYLGRWAEAIQWLERYYTLPGTFPWEAQQNSQWLAQAYGALQRGEG